MIVFIIVVLLVAGLILAIWFGSCTDSGTGMTGILVVAAAALIGLGALVAYVHGTGELSMHRPEQNAIYETLSSVPDGAGKYAVILKEQDGSLSAYVLAQDPPKMFKVTGEDRKIFEPFPPVSPAPSVPPKK